MRHLFYIQGKATSGTFGRRECWTVKACVAGLKQLRLCSVAMAYGRVRRSQLCRVIWVNPLACAGTLAELSSSAILRWHIPHESFAV